MFKAGSRNGGGLAQEAIERIGILYKIEEAIRGKPPEEIKERRQSESKVLVDTLYDWALENSIKVPPKSKLGMAFNYMLSEWKNLTTYLEDGRLAIDNNHAENAIRPFAIGRKNWIFCDTPEGAHASSILYSLVTSARANNIVPYEYLKSIYVELASRRDSGSSELNDLLPWNWKPSKT